jgi:hypothetical protein
MRDARDAKRIIWTVNAAATQTDNTVALVAVIITGAVGIIGPIILSLAAVHRQREEAKTLEERQVIELNAARARENRDARRAVLESGAIYLQDFYKALSNLKPVEGEHGTVAVPKGWDDSMNGLTTNATRLRLWFPASSEIVKAFETANTAIAYSWYANMPTPDEDDDTRAKREAKAARLNRQLDDARQRYLAAARRYLTDEPDPDPLPTTTAAPVAAPDETS